MRVLLFAILLVASGAVDAQSSPSGEPQPVTLTAITVTPGPVIVIAAAGPLPVPRVGILRGPDRIYVDLAGVSSRTLHTNGDGDLVTFVRVAQHSLDPMVARIVIDLKQPCQYTVNTSRRATGHLELSLTAGTRPSAGPDAIQPVPNPAVAPRAKSGAATTRRYVARLQPVLASLSVLRGVLHDIDKRMAPPADRMNGAQAELGHLRETLDAVRPPRRFEGTHDLLKSVVAFSSSALTLTSTSTGPVPSNASSAAAGALLMLDRGQAELQKSANKSL